MEKTNKTSIGLRVSKLRKTQGFSQSEMAHKIGVNARSIQKIESGETKDPSSSLIRDLAQCLNVTTDYLINGDQPHELALLIATAHKLKPSSLKILLSVALGLGSESTPLTVPTVNKPKPG